MRAYIFLAVSICAEVFATTMLKVSDGFTVLLPSIGVIAGYALSFLFLGFTLKIMPLSLAYAIWAGLGTALTTLISVVVWGEFLSVLKVIGILLIIGGVIVLNSADQNKAADSSS
jgi:multidrug resistance protein EbrB